jgi:hypothetical protein
MPKDVFTHDLNRARNSNRTYGALHGGDRDASGKNPEGRSTATSIPTGSANAQRSTAAMVTELDFSSISSPTLHCRYEKGKEDRMAAEDGLAVSNSNRARPV